MTTTPDTRPMTPIDTRHATPDTQHPTPATCPTPPDLALTGLQFDMHVDLGWLDKALTRGDLMTWHHATDTWLLTLAHYGVYGLRLMQHLDALIALHGVPDDMPYWLKTFVQTWASERPAPSKED